jgi:hypothetical protein
LRPRASKSIELAPLRIVEALKVVEHVGAALTLRHSIPAINQYREFAVAGGLISYGSDNRESFHEIARHRVGVGDHSIDHGVS